MLDLEQYQSKKEQVFASEQSGKKKEFFFSFFYRARSLAAAGHDSEATKSFFISPLVVFDGPFARALLRLEGFDQSFFNSEKNAREKAGFKL